MRGRTDLSLGGGKDAAGYINRQEGGAGAIQKKQPNAGAVANSHRSGPQVAPTSKPNQGNNRSASQLDTIEVSESAFIPHCGQTLTNN